MENESETDRAAELPAVPPLLVKAYNGKPSEATSRLQADSVEMAAEGYFPTWQNWVPGEWSKEAYAVAALLVFLFGVGLFVLAYLVIVEPDGTLTVAYERRASVGSADQLGAKSF